MREMQTMQQKAARPLEIAAQNRSLKQELVKERDDMKKLLRENAVLRDRSNRDWFLAGAGVVLASLFLGLVIPKIPWRRRRSWGEL